MHAHHQGMALLKRPQDAGQDCDALVRQRTTLEKQAAAFISTNLTGCPIRHPKIYNHPTTTQVKRASAERDETWKALVEQLQGENERCTKQAAAMLLPEQVRRRGLWNWLI